MKPLALIPLTFAAGVLLASSGCSSFERQMVFPGASSQGAPGAALPPSPSYELLSLNTSDGTRVAAQYGRALYQDGSPAPNADTVAPTVLYFYGNGSWLANNTEIFEGLRRLGANVCVLEYPGYGMSDGKPSERAFYAAADAAYEFLVNQQRTDPKRIVLVGWSMGGGVAIDLASRRSVAGVITLSTFTSLTHVGKKMVPWLPVSLLLRTRFDNQSKIASIRCPVLLLHGERDTLVPPGMADQLAKAATIQSVRVRKIPEAAHNDVFFAGGAATWTEMQAFIRSCTASALPGSPG